VAEGSLRMREPRAEHRGTGRRKGQYASPHGVKMSAEGQAQQASSGLRALEHFEQSRHSGESATSCEKNRIAGRPGGSRLGRQRSDSALNAGASLSFRPPQFHSPVGNAQHDREAPSTCDPDARPPPPKYMAFPSIAKPAFWAYIRCWVAA
jgi:hypothetical protein